MVDRHKNGSDDERNNGRAPHDRPAHGERYPRQLHAANRITTAIELFPRRAPPASRARNASLAKFTHSPAGRADSSAASIERIFLAFTANQLWVFSCTAGGATPHVD